MPGIVASIQTFGERINLHPHLHLLVTEGGEDSERRFHHLDSFHDSLLAEFFSREVFSLLLGKELISEALVEKIAGWRHSGFSVNSKVRAQTRKEAEQVGKYMIPLKMVTPYIFPISYFSTFSFMNLEKRWWCG